MQAIWKSKGEKLYTRNIEVTAYGYDEQKIIVEGFLKGDRCQKSRSITGEESPIGVIHHMAIRLLVNGSNRLIEDIDVDLISVPSEECRGTINCLIPIKGLNIAKGFTAKVKKIVGGTGCCTHLLELITAMAPVVVTGFTALQAQKSSAFNPDWAKKALQNLVNTCHTWREDGPLVEMLKKKLK
jgi:hypothetical protein